VSLPLSGVTIVYLKTLEYIMNARLTRSLILATVIATISLRPVSAAITVPGEYSMRGTYEGVLPCSDCPGVWTVLTLYDPRVDLGEGSGTFDMSERFTGGSRAGTTVTTHGTWSIVAWKREQGYTGTIELKSDGNGDASAPRYFYGYHGRVLWMTNADGSLVSDQHRELQRFIPPPPPQFGPLTLENANRLVEARVGDTFDVELPAESLIAAATGGGWKVVSPPTAGVDVANFNGTGDGKHYFGVFHIRAIDPGRTTLEFFNAADARHVRFTIDISP
jgi:hypothetical protein